MGVLLDIRWFSDGTVDAEKESDACEMRAPKAWALLMVHLERALIDPDFAKPYAVAADAGLFIFPEKGGREAVAYHYPDGVPQVLEVLAVGRIMDGPQRGSFVSQAQNRRAKSLTWLTGKH